MTFTEIDVADLVRHPGAFREVRVTGSVEGLGTEVARVREDVPVEGVLLLEAVVEGLLVSGRFTGALALTCSRCLDDVERLFAVEVHELFVDRPDPDGDDYELDPEGVLDLNRMAGDAIGLELPFAPLCREECLGLCEVCGGNRNLGQCPGHDREDPRWAGLADLLERLSD